MPSRDKRADPPFGRVRIDKWLWAARFYKTRSLAARAVEGGKVKLNGERVKPGKEVKVGDEIERRSGELHWLVEVRGVALKRGPAAEAALLYAEGEESRARREHMIAMRGAGPHAAHRIHGRPTKRDRRMIRRFTGD
ncbi:MAG: RNA-binding S4 domain-containing protein [Betaproteobacteria bacterium]|nr:MAG: RNA-binding S4 domain-containing protein [Betaproteobacteria bacterium]